MFPLFGMAMLACMALALLPVKALRLAMTDLLAADADTLAPATNANKIALVTNDFTPDEILTIDDFTLATFTGSAPKAGATGTQGTGTDPITLDRIITILAPAGGWRFICTAAPDTPETIYGFILVNDTGDEVLGMQKLDAPITITNVDDEIDLGAVDMRFVVQPAS